MAKTMGGGGKCGIFWDPEIATYMGVFGICCLGVDVAFFGILFLNHSKRS